MTDEDFVITIKQTGNDEKNIPQFLIMDTRPWYDLEKNMHEDLKNEICVLMLKHNISSIEFHIEE